MAGSSIFDYVHQADHAEVAEQLGLCLSSQSGGGMASPSESEEGSTSGTMNPDGECFFYSPSWLELILTCFTFQQFPPR
jgi:hypothetical protein